MAKETKLSLRQELKRKLSPSRMNPSHGFKKYSLGLAKVVEINEMEDFITLRILTGQQDEYQRAPVPNTYAAAGHRHMIGAIPEVGDVCFIGYQHQESSGGTPVPIILRWVSPSPWMGYDWNPSQPFSPEEFDFNSKNAAEVEGIFHRRRHKRKALYSGNVFLSSSQGSDILLDESVLITNRRANEIHLRDQDQSIVFRSLSQHHALGGARMYSGPVQRDARLLPSQMIKSNTIWDGGQQTDSAGDTLSEEDLPQNDLEEVGRISPANVFKRDVGAQTPESGLNFSSNIDPYFFLKKGLIIDEEGRAIDPDSSISDAEYGGKGIYRVSVDIGEDGFPLNAELGDSQNGRALSEIRYEVTHTTDGRLPVTEQTDGFDAERLPSSQGDVPDRLGQNQPFLEWVLGSVVGNDPYSEPGSQLYGLPLRATIFDSLNNSAPSIGSAIDSALGEHLAYLLRITPPVAGATKQSFIGLQKDGRLKASIGGPKNVDWSAEINSESGLIYNSGKHTRIQSTEGFSLQTSRGPEETNLGVDMFSENGAVRIYGGGKTNIGRLGNQTPRVGSGESDQPSVIIEGKGNVVIKSGRKLKLSAQNFDFGNSAQSSVSATSLVNIESGDKIRITSKTMDKTIFGKEVETFSGPKDFLPTNLPIRTEQFIANPVTGHVGGPTDEYRMLFGDRIENILIGNHVTTVAVGSATYQVVGGIWTAGAGTNRLAIDSITGMNALTTVGNITMTASTGAMALTSVLGTKITSAGLTNVSGVAGVVLGGPGKVGFIVSSSDLDPLTGLPLATFLMGSPGHTLGPPL